jgi:NTE family protein
MKIGVAFSGGGVRSAAQLGVVQALLEHNIKPEIFTGTSGGAIIATLLALGYTPKEALELFKDTNNIIDIAFIHILKGIITNSTIQGVVKGNRLEKTLDRIFDSKYIEEAKYPLAIVTTDYMNGRQVILSNSLYYDGDKINDNSYLWSVPELKLSEATRASCGLPGVFIPKQIGNLTLVDGGLVNNIPADIALALGATNVITIDVGGYYKGRNEVGNMYHILMQSFDIIYQRNVENNRKDFGITLNPSVSDVFVLDASQIVSCFERGYEYGLTIIDDVKKSINLP